MKWQVELARGKIIYIYIVMQNVKITVQVQVRFLKIWCNGDKCPVQKRSLCKETNKTQSNNINDTNFKTTKLDAYMKLYCNRSTAYWCTCTICKIVISEKKGPTWISEPYIKLNLFNGLWLFNDHPRTY